jgi:hypothetical protein
MYENLNSLLLRPLMHSTLSIPALTCPVPLTCPFLPWLVLSLCPVQSCPGLSCPSALSIPVLACPVPLPCPVSAALSRPLLSCPVYFSLVLLISTVSCVSLSLHCPVFGSGKFCSALQSQVGYRIFLSLLAWDLRSCLSYTFLSIYKFVMTNPFLSCPAHFCPFLSCPVHFYPVLSISVLS